MSHYLLAHDLGTSGNKATIYDFNGALKAFTVCNYPTHHLKNNGVEQNPMDWWGAVCESTRKLLSDNGIDAGEIGAVTFSGQMMGCVLVDAAGRSLRNALIWADARSIAQEAWLKEQMDPWHFYQITGHRPAAFYSLCKLLWVKENEPEIFQKTHKMLQAKDFIIHQLTGAFVTDYSDASGTNLFDLEKKVWSEEIMKCAGIPESLLPELHASTDVVGTVNKEAAEATGLLQGTPVVVGGGDGSCAALGAGVYQEGLAYVVLGSSSWISNAAKKPVFDPEMKTFNWVSLDPQYYTPCGTMQAAGYSVAWMKEQLCAAEQQAAQQTGRNIFEFIEEKVLQSPPGANELLYLPYLMGERSPRWNTQAKGAFVGLTVTTTHEDMLRAVYEGVGYNLKMILDSISKGQNIDGITAIGGGAKSNAWLQILADIWQKPVYVPRYLEEATSMGAAICAGKGIGVFSDFGIICQLNDPVKTVFPRTETADLYKKLYKIFDRLYDGMEYAYGRKE